LRIATRGSALARWQADHVASLLRAVDPSVVVEVVVLETTGDRRADVPIWQMGGKGVFVREVQAAVLDGRADLAVHSAKDLPSSTVEGLVIGAVPQRADPRDALVGSTLEDLPTAARVATGAARRRAQLAWLRPDLAFADLRGNVDTRLDKAAAFDAIVVAVAGLDRLGHRDRVTEALSTSVVVPQVAQGALAVECRDGEEATLALLRRIEHGPSRRSVDTARAFLAALGGDCDVPVGAHATSGDDGGLVLDGVLATLDGRVVVRDRMVGDEPVETGVALAHYLLDERGGRTLLATESAL
jgi:hydroxymethylbilane synthase